MPKETYLVQAAVSWYVEAQSDDEAFSTADSQFLCMRESVDLDWSEHSAEIEVSRIDWDEVMDAL